MRNTLLALYLLSCSFLTHADAVKYRQPNGKVLITNLPAGDSDKAVSTHRDEHVPAYSQQAAANDLQRQKEFLRTRERDNRAPVPSSSYASHSRGGTDMSGIYSCLQKVTATVGLPPYQEAARKVGCYGGSSGLNDDCQRSVAATIRLSNQDEAFLKRSCPQ